MIPLLLIEREAVAITKSVELCVYIDTNYSDAVSWVGDWFTDDGPKPFRGGRVKIVDNTGTSWKWLDSDGCKTFDVTVSVGTYPVTVRSKATLGAVTVNGWNGYEWENQSVEDVVEPEVNWFALVGTKEIHLDPTEVWRQMAVVVWAMSRNDFNLGTSNVSRDCCYADADPDDDGTCGNAADFYETDTNSLSSPTTIDVFDGQGNPDPEITTCSSSDVAIDADLDPEDQDFQEAVCVTANRMFTIAHELGHVVVEKRFDRRTEDESGWMDDEDEPACEGTYQDSEEEPLDPDLTDNTPGARGDFGPEFQSTAAREGWANFFAGWLFNRRTESDCQFHSGFKIHDFDLDGDPDDNYYDTTDTAADTGANYTDAPHGDGAYDCDQGPVLDEPYAADPMESYATGLDWLEQLVDADDDDEDGFQCDIDLRNRGSIYDTHRFWWDMTTDGDIPPEDLADVYVDMCPENWEVDDGNTSDTGWWMEPQMPAERLELSVAANSGGAGDLWNAFLVWRSNGQDH